MLDNATDNVDYFIKPIYPNVLKLKKKTVLTGYK